MGEHGAAHDVANRRDPRDIGCKSIIDHDAASIQRNAKSLKAQPFGNGTPANCDEDHIGGEHKNLASTGRFDPDLQARFRFFDPFHLMAETKFKTLFLQHALKLLGNFAIKFRQNAV